MLVLTVGILALNMMQITSTKGNTTANKLAVAGTVGGNGYERLLTMAYNDPTMDPAGNPHDQTELAGFQLPTGITSLSWNVTEWTNVDTLDNDGDGNVDEPDEVNIKNIDFNVNYSNKSAKTLTITFYKSEIY